MIAERDLITDYFDLINQLTSFKFQVMTPQLERELFMLEARLQMLEQRLLAVEFKPTNKEVQQPGRDCTTYRY